MTGIRLEDPEQPPAAAQDAKAPTGSWRAEVIRDRRGPGLRGSLERPAACIDRAYRRLIEGPAGLADLSRGAEWLLDNFTLVQRAVRRVRTEFSAEFERRLPRLADGEHAGQPRAWVLARQWSAEEEGPLDMDGLTRRARSFQRREPLRIAEIWALPVLLALAVLERLAPAASAIAGLDASAGRAAGSPAPASPDQSASTCIQNLRLLDVADWKRFFESVSPVEKILRRDPAGVYSRMDFETRDQYRKELEELAWNAGADELEVAEAAVSAGAASAGGRESHVGFHLTGPGRKALEARFGCRRRGVERLRGWMKDRPALFYLGSTCGLTLAGAVLVGLSAVWFGASWVRSVVAALLAVVPVSMVTISLVNWFTTRILKPQILPKMDFRRGIPEDCRTLVAVPSMLTDPAEIDTLLSELEIRYLAERDRRLGFVLLTDWADSDSEHAGRDDELLERAVQGVRNLNLRHKRGRHRPFHICHRRRRWNSAEGRWMGWERKRGKLAQFNRWLLAGERTDYILHEGDDAAFEGVRFVITLDADTLLPRGAARRLIATLAHPLNQAEIDPKTGRVTAGYTVLQPRVEVTPLESGATPFSKFFSGDVGLDLYTRAVSNVYQDLFGEGIFVGKGIYEVRSFERSLAGRVPENALLSHDLFEGIHGRSGLVTDIALLEDYPTSYLAFSRREHRWVRGDWQILPWLFPRVPLAGGRKGPNRLSLISRWKIFDNLRRSLAPISLLLFLVSAWGWLPGPPGYWTGLAVLVPAFPALAGLAGNFLRGARHTTLRPAFAGAADSFGIAVSRWFLKLAFLPHEAFTLSDAILRTLWRVFVSHKRRLEWTAAAHTARSLARSGSLLLWREMAAAPAFAIPCAVLLAVFRPQVLPVASPLLLLWALAPVIALQIGRARRVAPAPLPDPARRKLQILARRTWLFFESFVGPEDQWLAPDHFQEDPKGEAAHRTSPTNTGLMLTAALAAGDCGYAGTASVLTRLRNAFDTLDRMERHKGHFLNWYDTRDLQPLEPKYVSTVDSGNLAAALIVVKQACRELRSRPAVGGLLWHGLSDTLGALGEAAERAAEVLGRERLEGLQEYLEEISREIPGIAAEPERWAAAAERFQAEVPLELDRRLVRALEEAGDEVPSRVLHELRTWIGRVQNHLDSMCREAEMLVPWRRLLAAAPEGPASVGPASPLGRAWQDLRAALPLAPPAGALPTACRTGLDRLPALEAEILEGAPEESREAMLDWCRRLRDALVDAAGHGAHLLEGLEDLAARAESMVHKMDFSMLYDRHRQLFHIGFNVTEDVHDPNHYDLLASEARLASVIGIAKGDVPEKHWLHLGRPLGRTHGGRTLLSWSGTMFEYLMPPLFMDEGMQTLLGSSARAAVCEQIEYGRSLGVPWGISECGFYFFDAQRNYQYRAFGAPRLGFKRGLAEDLVVAPYASLLALALDPPAVVRNLEALEALGGSGLFGLYEALDFTPLRVPKERRCAVVRSHMAHHQGMTLAALNNFLNREPLRRRFHAEPMIQTVELLVLEKLDKRAPLDLPHPDDEVEIRRARPHTGAGPWRPAAVPPAPQAHVLSNGDYSLLLTSGGSSNSSWRGMDLTPWCGDGTLEDAGFRIYLADAERQLSWSVGPQSVSEAADRQVIFHAHLAELHRQDFDVSSVQKICVAPDEDVEIRHFTLANEGREPKRLGIAGYGEVVLADRRVHRRHPAFSKLFVESEYLPELHALLFRRRPRASSEREAWLLHMLVLPEEGAQRAGHETSREAFLGRGRTRFEPAALQGGRVLLTGGTGCTLDPVMVLGAEVEIPPHRTLHLGFVTLCAATRQDALDLARRYQSLAAMEWAADRAKDASERELAELGLPPDQLPAVQDLLSRVLFPGPAGRAPLEVLARNLSGQAGLWKYGVSGDLPILLARVREKAEAVMVQELLRTQAFWRGRGQMVDLIVLNEHATGYTAELTEGLSRLVASAGHSGWLNRPGGIFLLHADQMPAADRDLLRTAASVVMRGWEGGLTERAKQPAPPPAPLPYLYPTHHGLYDDPPLERPTDLQFDNGYGGFSADGSEYFIHLEPGGSTPAPWVNVIANPGFGFVVSESGGGYTWCGNSGENRLSPWTNDPVTDESGEAVYLRDEESGAIWSPTPAPARGPGAYQIRHGAGYTVFHHRSHGLDQELQLFAAWHDPVKIVRLKLANRTDRQRRLTATYYLEWVLGSDRMVSKRFLVPEYDAENETLLARNPWSSEYAGRVAFLAADRRLHDMTGDRTEFLGRAGRRSRPEGLRRIGTRSTVQPGTDPCGAFQVHVDLGPGESTELHFLVGQGADRTAALELAARYREPGRIQAALEEVHAGWSELLGAVQVSTPDPGLDLMLNRWLLYQVLTSRFWGRTGFYQSSGAFGFRDQVQDSLALLHCAPELTRQHLLDAAARQFAEGDVLHWWHPPSGKGIRTRCSDDRLWLPFAAAAYVEATGDDGILREEAPFLRGPALEPGETEAYGHFEADRRPATFYEHCVRALEQSRPVGVHRLPLIGSCDWNDGLDQVGRKGRGESVWLAWFLITTLRRFAPLCRAMGEEALADDFLVWAEQLASAAEEHAWDGGWYLRAWFDDGDPLGSASSHEGRLDSIAQSWAAFAGARADRVRAALEALDRELVDEDQGWIRLLTPPFDRGPQDPGYIRGYPPGVRENGGQYTHAAVWALWALAETGQAGKAARCFRMLLPLNHARDLQGAERYRVEPYALAADVYAEPPHAGRGGWTWYTGAAAWAWRFGAEVLLGIRPVAGGWRLQPRLPAEWPGFEATLRHAGAVYRIKVENPAGGGEKVVRTTLDGSPLEDAFLPHQAAGRTYVVQVVLG